MQPVGPVTISVGVALFPEHGTDMEALIDVADRAMYASKQMGRNRVTLAGREPVQLAAAAYVPAGRTNPQAARPRCLDGVAARDVTPVPQSIRYSLAR